MTYLVYPRTVTKTGQAYLALHRAIITGEIRPNEPIDEAETCARFALGRTPCREALKRLAIEHVLVWPERRSPFVRSVDATEQERLDEARLTLETRTAALAAERRTQRHLDDLYHQVEEMRVNLLSGQAYEAVLCDYRIHHGIAVASGNRFLAEAVAALDMSTLRQWYAAMSTQDTSGVADGHRTIVDAIAAQDVAAALAYMTSHVHESLTRQESLHRTQHPAPTDPRGDIDADRSAS